MRILLDTQILLWQIQADPRLSGPIRDSLEDRDAIILVSDVSLLEVALKKRTGKLDIDPATFEKTVKLSEYERLAINRRHIAQIEAVPLIHRDPFDHLLIAQAMIEDIPILTADRKFAAYPIRLAVG